MIDRLLDEVVCFRQLMNELHHIDDLQLTVNGEAWQVTGPPSFISLLEGLRYLNYSACRKK